MRKRLITSLVALVTLSLTLPAGATTQVTVTGHDGANPATNTNPLDCQMDVGNATISATNPAPVQGSQGNAAIGVTNGWPVQMTDGTNFLGTSAHPVVTNGPTAGSNVNVVSVAGSAIALSNPLFTQISADGTNAVNTTHGLYFNLLQGNAVNAASNPSYLQLTNGTNANDATHGSYFNLLQGNAVISATNPLFTNLSVGSAATSITNAVPTIMGNSTISTYLASTGYFTPVATATDMVGIVGSGTKTIKIQKITMSGTQTTAGINKYFLIKRSTADTGSTPSAATLVPLDSTNAAATAVVQTYTTTNPTTGTPVGTIASKSIADPAPAAVSGTADVVLFDAKNSGQPIVLRGVAQELDLNFAGAAIPSGLSVSVDVQFTEE